MQSLIRFIYKNRFFFTFFLLQSIALTTFFSKNSFHRSSFINSSNAVAGSIYEQKAAVAEYLNLSEKNAALAEHNAELLNASSIAFRNVGVTRKLVKDTVLMQQYNFITAKVINSSVKHRNNYITIDRGASSGVKLDMGVICSEGIVGFVQEVSKNYAVVVPVLNNQFTASVRLKKSNFFGLLKWSGIDPTVANLKDIPKHADVAVGDTIVTRGSSSYFPAGIMVGTVLEVAPEGSANYHELRIALSTDFYNLNYVYVVENLLQLEQEQLEQSIVENDR